MTPNEYFRVQRGRVKQVDLGRPEGQWGYVLQCVAEMDARLGPRGLTVFLTNDVRTLPQTGNDVVAVVLRDEMSLVPRWASAVRATFKTLGHRPTLVARPRPATAALDALALYAWAAAWTRGLPGRLRHRHARVHDIPIGPYALIPDGLVIRPPAEREVDVSFAGSTAGVVESRIPTHRDAARRRLIDAVREYAAARPERRVDLHLTETFAASKAEPREAYWQRLAAARICLAPRGTVGDTHRWFEGLAAGCTVVHERLPRTWYYAGAPTIERTGWRDLAPLLDRLLDDREALAERQRAGLAWWRERCAPPAVGAYMAECVSAAGDDAPAK